MVGCTGFCAQKTNEIAPPAIWRIANQELLPRVTCNFATVLFHIVERASLGVSDRRGFRLHLSLPDFPATHPCARARISPCQEISFLIRSPSFRLYLFCEGSVFLHDDCTVVPIECIDVVIRDGADVPISSTHNHSHNCYNFIEYCCRKLELKRFSGNQIPDSIGVSKYLCE